MHNVPQRDTVKDGVKGRERKDVCVKVNSRVIQQQDNGVELFPGSVISPERHNEVIETVPRSLSRHNDELVFKTISLSILETVVPATLHREQKKKKKRYFRCCEGQVF